MIWMHRRSKSSQAKGDDKKLELLAGDSTVECLEEKQLEWLEKQQEGVKGEDEEGSSD
jgi:hypothetical protein